jgi:hypothetical protein
VNESILAILVLYVLAGGGLIVIDSLIIRKIRRLGPPSAHAQTDLEEPSDDAVV